MLEFEKTIDCTKETGEFMYFSPINEVVEFVTKQKSEARAFVILPKFVKEETELTLHLNRPVTKVTVLTGPRSANPAELTVPLQADNSDLHVRYNVPVKVEVPDEEHIGQKKLADASAIMLNGMQIYVTTNLKHIIPIMLNKQNLVVGKIYF